MRCATVPLMDWIVRTGTRPSMTWIIKAGIRPSQIGLSGLPPQKDHCTAYISIARIVACRQPQARPCEPFCCEDDQSLLCWFCWLCWFLQELFYNSNEPQIQKTNFSNKTNIHKTSFQPLEPLQRITRTLPASGKTVLYLSGCL